MFSFLILVMIFMFPCFKEIINGKHFFKCAVKIILLLVAVYLKSINL